MKKYLLLFLLIFSMSVKADVIVIVKDNYRAPSSIAVINGVCIPSAYTKRFQTDVLSGGRILCYSKELILYKQIQCHYVDSGWDEQGRMECK